MKKKKLNLKKKPSILKILQNWIFRIGTILEAEKIPKTKKLLKLKVDVGIDIKNHR